MKQTAEQFSIQKWWEDFLAKTPSIYVSLFLGASGTWLLWKYPEGYFRHALGEASSIAALLILFVDPFLKARLLREASAGIFHYLLGFDQQPEIKERLRDLVFNTKLFRRNFYMKCILTPQENSMLLNLECTFEIINPTNEAQKYVHCVQCEDVEKPAIKALTLISEKDSYSTVPALTGKKDDPTVLEAIAKEIEIQPASKGLTYHFGTNFSMIYPLEFFYALHVGTPTIGMTIEIVPPEGFNVTVSPSPTYTKNIWKHDKLFMPGEHVDVRWKKV